MPFFADSGTVASPIADHATPTAPNARNTAFHPTVWMRLPANSSPNALPQLKNVNMRLRLELRLSAGTDNATAAADAGITQPDAAPKSTRAATMTATGVVVSVAAGIIATPTDHRPRPASRTLAPPNLSAATPPRICVTP